MRVFVPVSQSVTFGMSHTIAKFSREVFSDGLINMGRSIMHDMRR